MDSNHSTFFHQISTVEATLDFQLSEFDAFSTEIHPLCLHAIEELKAGFLSQPEWKLKFGVDTSTSEEAIGKMFGILLVRNDDEQLGYLAAFSGKLSGSNHHRGFVPPIYDSLTEDGFLVKGMTLLRQLGEEIEREEEGARKTELIGTRARTSAELQSELFDQYYFSNGRGEKKGLRQIFNKELGKNPPTAAGECAAPKLLQYAFDNGLRPMALAEFWWGASTRSVELKHGHFYPPCEDKCRPILNHMLS